jgi:hypothetical protein
MNPKVLRDFWKTDVVQNYGSAAAGPAPQAVAARKQQGKPPTQTINMDEEVIEVGLAKGSPGDTGEQMIKDQLTTLQTYIGDYWSNYQAGIQKFTNRMAFSSEEEAEPKHLKAVFTAFTKMALDKALGALPEPLGEIVKTGKALAEAYVAESERAAAAGGEVKVVQYVNGLIDGVDKHRKAMRDAVENAKPGIITEFRRVAKTDNLKGKASEDGVIVGDAARVIKGVQKGVAAFSTNTPSAAKFEQQFARAFADTPGRTDLVSHGGVEAGKLYFKIQVKPDFSVDESNTSDAWILVTLNEKPERVAASLLESLEGGKPWQVDLGKKVMLRVEEDAFPLNKWHDGWIMFTNSPDSYSIGGFTDAKLAAKVWGNNTIRSRVLNTAKLTGTKSEPGF